MADRAPIAIGGQAAGSIVAATPATSPTSPTSLDARDSVVGTMREPAPPRETDTPGVQIAAAAGSVQVRGDEPHVATAASARRSAHARSGEAAPVFDGTPATAPGPAAAPAARQSEPAGRLPAVLLVLGLMLPAVIVRVLMRKKRATS